MKLTPEQLRLNAAAMVAHADRKPIECYDDEDGWIDTKNLGGILSIPHRPKPEPKARPWSKLEDYNGAEWFSGDGGQSRFRFVGISSAGVFIGTRQTVVPWAELKAFWKHSMDGLSWHKCEVTEES